MPDIERLTSDKADLTDRLQCFEEDLKTTNECENLLCGMSMPWWAEPQGILIHKAYSSRVVIHSVSLSVSQSVATISRRLLKAKC